MCALKIRNISGEDRIYHGVFPPLVFPSGEVVVVPKAVGMALVSSAYFEEVKKPPKRKKKESD